MRFTEPDRSTLAELAFDPSAEPSYELLRACLIWPDERPTGITNHGYELLGDLWIVRGFMHRKVPRDRWGFNPESKYFETVWTQAMQDVPQWPGFRRLQLSASDEEYLLKCIEESATTEY